ncbi:MAG: hypothetical protein GYA55_13280 [SAR324 cluster bacterium]|uniref:Fimbrial assembly protein n=1 Tax=SAR324 cluster bacterium TaxID=2024889 RepID=A0A7X9FTP5_9DELT|nr:hypothetical protein [SAR324 cluster bacterium]
MIKINLLGAETSTDTSGTLQIFLYLLSLVATVIVCFVIYSFDSSAVAKLEKENANLQGQLDKLKEQTKEVRDLETRRQELRRIAGAIGKLKVIQVGPVKILSAINEALPAKVWIREISDKDGEVIINGIALDDFSVSSFLKNLSSVDIFKSVDLELSASTNLLQVAAFNAFESSLLRYVIPVEEKKALLSQIKKEAEKQGLRAAEEQPHIDKWKQAANSANSRGRGSGGSVKSEAGNVAVQSDYNAMDYREGDPNRRILGFGTRNYTKDPTIYIWSSLEESDGKSFRIRISTDFLKPEGISLADTEPTPASGKGGVSKSLTQVPKIPPREVKR